MWRSCIPCLLAALQLVCGGTADAAARYRRPRQGGLGHQPAAARRAGGLRGEPVHCGRCTTCRLPDEFLL